MTITDFSRRLRAGDTTSEAETRACLERIAQDNARLNAFILVMADEALEQARRADRELADGRDRGPLHGVPMSIKDLLDVQGTPTTAASRVREGHVASADAMAVARLRDAGAVFVGKTNLHEFAFGTTNEDSAFGPARNPFDDTRSPGGSSGGSAISVRTGMAMASIGTDTGGSIRIPAAACGLVGLKPTYGEVSTDGVVPLSRSCDHVGPLTQSVSDAAVVYHVLSGRAPATAPATTLTTALTPAPVERLRLGVPRAYFCDLLDDDVRARFEEALDRLRAAGATIDEVAIPHAALTGPVYLHISLPEAIAYHRTTLDAMPERYTAPVRQRLEWGKYVMGEDYVRALAARDVLCREVDAALSGHDALVLPTLPIPAPPIGAASIRVGASDQLVRNMMLRLTQLFNVTGHPAIALPCGATRDGLPCSLQLVGARSETDALLRVALASEAQVSSAFTIVT